MTMRNRSHSRTMLCIGCELENWLRQQPEPRGQAFSGDAGVRLRRDPELFYGVDVVYVSADVMANQPEDTTIIEGIPTLAVEILSPSDTQDDIEEKLDAYLASGIPLVWLLNTRRRTVTVHRPDHRPRLFNEDDVLTAEPHLPGFAVPVTRLFG